MVEHDDDVIRLQDEGISADLSSFPDETGRSMKQRLPETKVRPCFSDTVAGVGTVEKKVGGDCLRDEPERIAGGVGRLGERSP